LLFPAARPACIASEQRNLEITARIPRKSGMIGVLAPEEPAREGLHRVEARVVAVEVLALCEQQYESKQRSCSFCL